MKVEFNDGKLIVYLYNSDINIDEIDKLNSQIKKIFIKLIRQYKLDFYGYIIVTIYHNKKYGLVLEIEKIESDGYYSSMINLKIIIYKNVDMFLEFDDYLFYNKPKYLIIKNNKYYLNIDNIDNINKYIEYSKLIFKKN